MGAIGATAGTGSGCGIGAAWAHTAGGVGAMGATGAIAGAGSAWGIGAAWAHTGAGGAGAAGGTGGSGGCATATMAAANEQQISLMVRESIMSFLTLFAIFPGFTNL